MFFATVFRSGYCKFFTEKESIFARIFEDIIKLFKKSTSNLQYPLRKNLQHEKFGGTHQNTLHPSPPAEVQIAAARTFIDQASESATPSVACSCESAAAIAESPASIIVRDEALVCTDQTTDQMYASAVEQIRSCSSVVKLVDRLPIWS